MENTTDYYDGKVAVRVIEPNKKDTVIGFLGGYNLGKSMNTDPVFMCNPDISLPAGVPFTFYLAHVKTKRSVGARYFSGSPATTQITGYFMD